MSSTATGRLAALLPHLDLDELAWRHATTLGLAGFLGSGVGSPLTRASDDAPDQFVPTTSAL